LVSRSRIVLLSAADVGIFRFQNWVGSELPAESSGTPPRAEYPEHGDGGRMGMSDGHQSRTSSDLDRKEEKLAMDARGIIVPPDRSSVSPGRSFSPKLRSGETGASIMMFEEAVPAGTKSTFHLHHDSDEVAYVLSGEVTFKIGDEVTVGGPGTCAFMPRACHTPGRAPAWKPGACCFSILPPRQAG
jgi:mannose-6-phosphate isomerase-like protein (cupin superfamily)